MYVFYSIPSGAAGIFTLLAMFIVVFLLRELLIGLTKIGTFKEDNTKPDYSLSGRQLGWVFIFWCLCFIPTHYISNYLISDFKNEHQLLQVFGFGLLMFGWLIPYFIFRSYNKKYKTI